MSVLLLAWNNPITVHNQKSKHVHAQPIVCLVLSPTSKAVVNVACISGSLSKQFEPPCRACSSALHHMFASVNKRQDANTRASSLWWGLVVEGFFSLFISKKKITIRHPQMPLLMCHLLLIQSYPQRRSRIVLYSAFVVQENFILILLNTVCIKFPLKLFFLLNEKSNTNSFQLSVPLFSRSSAVF